MINLLYLVPFAGIAYKIGDDIYQKSQIELNKQTSKFKLDRDFLTNKLGIENIPNPHVSLKECQALRSQYKTGIEALKKAEAHKLAGTDMYPVEVETAPLPARIGFTALTALLMYSRPWDPATCFVAVVTGAIVAVPPMVEIAYKNYAERVISHYKGENNLGAIQDRLKASEKTLNKSINELKKVKQIISDKMSENIEDNDNKYAAIQLTKIDLILSDISLAQQQDGQAPA